MNKKTVFFTFTVVFSLLFSVSGFGQEIKTARANVRQNSSLASLLPDSDAVLNIDTARLLNEALPKMLTTKPQFLRELNEKLDLVKANTGIDMRQFDEISVGIAYKTISAKETDFAPVILARGKFKAGAFLGLAKLAAKGKYREEMIGEKTVYIFSPKEILENNQPTDKGSFPAKILDRAMKSLTQEVAVTDYDDNTLVLGSLDRVRETFESTTRVNKIPLELAAKIRAP